MHVFDLGVLLAGTGGLSALCGHLQGLRACKGVLDGAKYCKDSMLDAGLLNAIDT